MIEYRWMANEEVERVGEIDRSERIRTGFRMDGGELVEMAVNWDSPAWAQEGEGDYSVTGKINFCRGHLARNGRLYGAFDGDRLVGIGLIQPNIEEGMAQLAFLHVSNGYRRSGIGRLISAALIEEAKRGWARRIYVSATPSGSAVGFYRELGFEVAKVPNPELCALEPDDIHMVMRLRL